MIDENRDRLEHVDRTLDYAIRQAKDIFSVRLQTSESFLNLLWPKCPEAEWLTPVDESRTLQDVVTRILDSGHEFEALAEGHRSLPDEHDTDFFVKFPYLDEHFDRNKMGILAIAALGDDEQKESPKANFYIYDGLARATVYARHIMNGREKYEPVQALLVIPRPL